MCFESFALDCPFPEIISGNAVIAKDVLAAGADRDGRGAVRPGRIIRRSRCGETSGYMSS